MTEIWNPEIWDINGPFVGSHAVSEGVMTRNQLRSPLFLRLFQNSYVPAKTPMSHELRCRAAAVIAPPEAVLTGWSAAAVRGLDFADTHDLVEFVLPEDVKFVSQRGMHIRRTRRGEIASEPWHGIGLATPMRMTLDLLTNTKLHRSLPRVVGYLDMILRTGLVEPKPLAEWLEARHDNGITRARKAAELADDRAESIPESELRVRLRLAGLEPAVQLNVWDDFGNFLGRLDLAFPECKLAVEYDGEWHRDEEQTRHDNERRAAFRTAGWEFVVVTKDWWYDDPRSVVDAVQTALWRRSAVS